MMTTKTLTTLGIAVALACALAGSAFAQEETTPLPASQAPEYIGEWTLTMEFGDMTLTFTDDGGNLAATLVSDQRPEPTAITDISKSDEGLHLEFDSDFGRLAIDIALEAGLLAGSLTSEDGAFDLELTGKREEEVEGGEAASEEENAQARRRRGPAISEIAFDGKAVKTQIGTVPADGVDHAAITDTADGQIVRFTVASAAKLMTDVDLAFGDVTIVKENVAENYPGVYSLWLKKSGSGWNLVFNERADVWGTQHNAEADVAEVALAYEMSENEQENMTVTLSLDGDNGTLAIAWGAHLWKTNFASAE